MFKKIKDWFRKLCERQSVDDLIETISGESYNTKPQSSKFSHDYSFKRTNEGYGVCRCGVRENTNASTIDCNLAIKAAKLKLKPKRKKKPKSKKAK